MAVGEKVFGMTPVHDRVERPKPKPPDDAGPPS
jgi:hypothetical protein